MLQFWVARFHMAISTKTRIDGLWVGASGDDEADLFSKACDALDLIKTHDPIRYRRLLSDVRWVWVGFLPGANGCYRQQTGTCEIRSGFAATAHPIFIASIIVHEATHARMRRFGYDEEMRYRLEQICRRQQYKFAEKHPGGDVVQTWLDSFPPLRPDRLTDRARIAIKREALVQAAYDLGMPSWLVRTLLRIHDYKVKRAFQIGGGSRQ